MTSRRRVLLGLAATGFVGSLRAQGTGKRHKLGWLTPTNLHHEPHYQAFGRRLAELGFVEGRNLVIERRWGNGDIKSLPPLASELAALKCDVLFGGGTEANLAALVNAGREIPIVFVATDFDPVRAGFVKTLARPGVPITGINAQQATMPAKRLELMKECLPRLDRVAIFTNDATREQLDVVANAAQQLGTSLRVIDFKQPPFDFRAGFAEAARARANGLHVLGSVLWASRRREIVELALRDRLPTMFHQADWVKAGGLMSYGFDFTSMWRRAAEQVASILNGANAATIPMEQPSTFELAINAATARVLGLKIPESIRIRADKVFE